MAEKKTETSKLAKDNVAFNIWSGTTNVKIKSMKLSTTLYI
jgi:hypothetical protein